jgi:hypothetical protein
MIPGRRRGPDTKAAGLTVLHKVTTGLPTLDRTTRFYSGHRRRRRLLGCVSRRKN